MRIDGPVRAAFLLAVAMIVALPQSSPAKPQVNDPVMISEGNDIESHPVVAWGEYGFGVVWFKGNQLRYTLLDEDCEQDQPPITIHSIRQDFDDKRASIAYHDEYFYVVFLKHDGDGQQVFLQTVHYDYDPPGGAIQLTTGNYTHLFPKLVWNGREFGLAYIRDYCGSTGSELYFQRLDAQLKKIGEPRIIVYNADNIYFSDLVWTGKYWGLAWVRDLNQIYFARLKRTGKIKGASRRVFLSDNDNNPKDLDLEPGDRGGYALAFSWAVGEDDPSQIHVQILRKNGKNTGPLRQVSNSSVGARYPSITLNKLHKLYGVFWSDGRDKGKPPSSHPRATESESTPHCWTKRACPIGRTSS